MLEAVAMEAEEMYAPKKQGDQADHVSRKRFTLSSASMFR